MRFLFLVLLAGVLDVEDEPHVAERHTGLTGAELNGTIYLPLTTRRLVP